MEPYLNLLRDVYTRGIDKPQRAKVGGRSLLCRSLFAPNPIRLDLAAGFPLLTTKRMAIRPVAVELLWFLSGSTNNNDLLAQNVRIWDAWADPVTGELGPVYGKQWRRWEAADGRRVDQITELVQNVRAVAADPWHPAARRLLLTAWNPGDMPPPTTPTGCHTLAQFNVTAGRLSCHLYQRSADMLLGVPYNIASYALLTHLLARVTGLGVGEYVHSFGDAHVYENHFEQVAEQLTRTPRPLPTLVLADDITSLDDVRVDQISVAGYDPHPPIRGEVAV
ncbi:thymidylate synthase [Urbifossiella limnaea]|uniref:Thymidylate synthase n=1 Tax=Urbifossiella limnaea TaxID=2528023 RepID=A0A517Y0W9_9BACT|nr:thymidylate synthase [Urbifossiella limnaea]QDU23409.1 Thymidylate synthase 2 [Urbifossiella limnaea]